MEEIYSNVFMLTGMDIFVAEADLTLTGIYLNAKSVGCCPLSYVQIKILAPDGETILFLKEEEANRRCMANENILFITGIPIVADTTINVTMFTDTSCGPVAIQGEGNITLTGQVVEEEQLLIQSPPVFRKR